MLAAIIDGLELPDDIKNELKQANGLTDTPVRPTTKPYEYKPAVPARAHLNDTEARAERTFNRRRQFIRSKVSLPCACSKRNQTHTNTNHFDGSFRIAYECSNCGRIKANNYRAASERERTRCYVNYARS